MVFEEVVQQQDQADWETSEFIEQEVISN